MADCHLFTYRTSENYPAVDEMIKRITQAVLIRVFKLPKPVVLSLAVTNDNKIPSASSVSIDVDSQWIDVDLDDLSKQQVLRSCLPIITQIVRSASHRINWRTHAVEELAWRTIKIPFNLHAHVHRNIRQLDTPYTQGVEVTLYNSFGDSVLGQTLGATLMSPANGEIVTGQLARVISRAAERKVAIVTPRTGADRVLLLAHNCDPTPAVGSFIHAITVPARGRIFHRMVGWTTTQGSLFADPLPFSHE